MPDNYVNAPLTHLGELPIEEFLREFWQKKPLLIRQALPNIPVLDPNELAGYALEEGVESRLILEKPKAKNPLASAWRLSHGPFDEHTFAALPATHWTLLVQAVNQLHPEIHSLLQRFCFLPNWRVDDVMVSYAVDKGGVGPHFDYYDVFLLQASGQRHWRVGQMCDANSQLRQDTDCKILASFDTSEEWLLEPGDLLYLPPRIAHWGVAQGECLTYSIGFRAPSQAEILLDCAQEIASTQVEDQRFTDPDRPLSPNPGLISNADLQQIKNVLQRLIEQDDVIADWFGRFMTQPRRDSLQFDLNTAGLSPGVRAAYRLADGQEAILYINGEQYRCSVLFAEHICASRPVGGLALTKDERTLLKRFIEDGHWQ